MSYVICLWSLLLTLAYRSIQTFIVCIWICGIGTITSEGGDWNADQFSPWVAFACGVVITVISKEFQITLTKRLKNENVKKKKHYSLVTPYTRWTTYICSQILMHTLLVHLRKNHHCNNIQIRGYWYILFRRLHCIDSFVRQMMSKCYRLDKSLRKHRTH